MRKTIEISDRDTAREVLGVGDSHLRRVKEALGVSIFARNEQLHIEGSDTAVGRAARAFLAMQRIVRKTQHLQMADVDRILDVVEEDGSDEEVEAAGVYGHPHARKEKDEGLGRPLAGRVRAMTSGQERYLQAIRSHDIVFSIGPAGSGKTYLAVASAIEALSKNQVNRIVLVRPAVEAGERLGFLPGDLAEKVNPYLRPLYDALHDMLNPHQVARFSEKGVIEIAPLAFMRGRTLNSAFVILDEAQNTTPKQMKMFLTRLGRDAKAVVTGDVTQVDLPEGDLSGLSHAARVLKDVEGVSFVHLEKQDIVRHPLVQRIVHAYDKEEAED
ncbi:MAG TPA: PhoH family protein [Planctomycetota bacterium]|nr:PhoH family protein [Planctomycetota bacterium]